MNESGRNSSEELGWLAGAMDAAADRPILWRPDELAAMLSHQLAAPIRGNLEAMPGDIARRHDNVVPREIAFGELLGSPHPPTELLRAVKDFAKRAISVENGSLPVELGAALYFASIACARLRCDQAISGLDGEALAYGTNLAMSQPWLDASLLTLLQEFRERFTATSPRI
jgi:hypothetical protein